MHTNIGISYLQLLYCIVLSIVNTQKHIKNVGTFSIHIYLHAYRYIYIVLPKQNVPMTLGSNGLKIVVCVSLGLFESTYHTKTGWQVSK